MGFVFFGLSFWRRHVLFCFVCFVYDIFPLDVGLWVFGIFTSVSVIWLTEGKGNCSSQPSV